MGRVSRYKKQKKFNDPDAGKKDQAPGRVKEKPGKALRRILEAKNEYKRKEEERLQKKRQQKQIENGERKPPKEKSQPSAGATTGKKEIGLKREFNESLEEFERRVDREYSGKVTKTFSRGNRKAEKFNNFLKKKKAKKQGKLDENDQFNSKGEQVKFGEVVQAPPDITKLPRRKNVKSTGQPLLLEKGIQPQKEAETGGKKPAKKLPNQKPRLNPASQSQTSEISDSDAAPKESGVPKAKKRKHMDEATKRIMDAEREAAIQQYRALKKQRTGI
eukprot:comp12722_c0_seq1/m.7832 comp12722_c0_seq1/g.7832  ORF comp12722_c0_seq1/g.7832 comp12722_c0_seq1/m.7832 type:complete len:275 (-) comp12722_c0_seq1:138-962(-)